jgi:predicted dehydrogenase
MPTAPTFAIVGCGHRGADVYGAWLLRHPDRGRVVAVADIDPARRARVARAHGVSAAHAFPDGAALLAEPRLADALILATPDASHADLTVAALERGYDLLLEKPIATTPTELERVAAAAAGHDVTVAHVLRYAPLMRAVKRVLAEGRLGQLVHVLHEERIGAWHFAHSYVRGNWHREATSSPMLLAKACHDLDLLGWWMGAAVRSVVSTGRLAHFRPERAPAGATERCLDCPAAPDCPYDAGHLYLERFAGHDGWPIEVVTDDASPAGRRAALRTGSYGRCVYLGDNDVLDHQVVVLDFDGGVTATLVVNAFHPHIDRRLTLTGSHAELRGSLADGTLELVDHRSGRVSPVEVEAGDDADDGHGGGDAELMRDFAARVAARRAGGTLPSPTGLADAVTSHRLAFAAEAARKEGRALRLESDGRIAPGA